MHFHRDLRVIIDKLIHRSLIDELNREYRSLFCSNLFYNNISILCRDGWRSMNYRHLTMPLWEFRKLYFDINHYSLSNGKYKYFWVRTTKPIGIPINY